MERGSEVDHREKREEDQQDSEDGVHIVSHFSLKGQCHIDKAEESEDHEEVVEILGDVEEPAYGTVFGHADKQIFPLVDEEGEADLNDQNDEPAHASVRLILPFAHDAKVKDGADEGAEYIDADVEETGGRHARFFKRMDDEIKGHESKRKKQSQSGIQHRCLFIVELFHRDLFSVND